MEDDIYFKINGHWEGYNSVFVHIMWSSNDSYEPSSTGVIGIYTYDDFGREHKRVEGGEMDDFDDKSLAEHIPDVLDFIGFSADEEYELLTEEEFPIEFK